MIMTISSRLELVTPHGYEKKPFPGLNKWLNALRSGQYKQGQDYLHNDDTMCCLGVLCSIQERPKLQLCLPRHLVRFTYDGDSMVLMKENPAYEVLGENGDFPPSVSAYVLPDPEAKGIRKKTMYQTLIGLNDEGIPFTDIATLIEHLWYDPEVAP